MGCLVAQGVRVVDGPARPEGRNQGHGPRTLGHGGGAGRPEGGTPATGSPALSMPSYIYGLRTRTGCRGGADRGQAQGKDERGAAWRVAPR